MARVARSPGFVGCIHVWRIQRRRGTSAHPFSPVRWRFVTKQEHDEFRAV